MTSGHRFRSDFMQTFVARGHFHSCTDAEALDGLFLRERVTAYIGFDCTAPSFHIGNLVQLMTLRRLQQSGHRPILLMGGGTTRIGDPSGKDEIRQLLSPEQIEANKQSILKDVSHLLHFGDGPADAIMVDNAEWLGQLEYVPFLRDVGRHLSINRMLSMESVRLRLEREQPLSFLEFNYMVLQAYDFVELARRYGCRLQSGGSDQWGNIVGGVDLGRRMGTHELFGLTTPLITTSSGAKMGKTAEGAVWLNPKMRSPYEYWQYWRNAEDADVGRFMRIFTDLPLDEIAAFEKLGGSERNEAKKVLATEATALLHGREAANDAAETARRTFEEGVVADGLPSFTVARAKLAAGVAVTMLARMSGLTASTSEARRQIEGGGLRVNDERVEDVNATVGLSDLGSVGAIKLSLGRKKHVLIRPE